MVPGMDLGRVGVWQYQLDQLPSARAKEVAAEIMIYLDEHNRFDR